MVCKPIVKPYLDFAPSLVAEILSPATALKDKHTKFQQIRYYIIISSETEEVEVYMNDSNIYSPFAKRRQFVFNFLFEENCSAETNFEEIWRH